MRRVLLAALLVAGPALAVDVTYAPGSDNDPRVREAVLLDTLEKYYSAASELMNVEAEQPNTRLPSGFYRRLADTSLSFGLENRAAQIYAQNLSDDDDQIALYHGQIRLAEFLHERGRDEEAIQRLQAMRAKLPRKLERDWQDVLSRALLSQGRYSEAAELLSDKTLFGDQDSFSLYNLGVAMAMDGRTAQGLSVIDRVGRLIPFNERDESLRDQANLMLGYQFLRQGQGATAVPIFERVRSEGAISNRALLGLGWAFLAPAGARQDRVDTGEMHQNPEDIDVFHNLSTIGVLMRPGYIDQDIYRHAGITPFKRSRGSDSEEAAFKHALVPWLLLASRDRIDPSVQEALLAIPYCLEQLGAHQQAEQYYERAIKALEAGRRRIYATLDYVKSGRMLRTMIHGTADSEAGWRWKLNDLPSGDETFYLQRLISENRFQEQVKNYRDALMLRHRMDEWLQRIDALQSDYIHRQPEDIPPEVLFQRSPSLPDSDRSANGKSANSDDENADLPGLPPAILKTDTHLSPPNPGAAPAAAGPTVAPSLQVAKAPPPAQFLGTYERLDQLKARIQALSPKLDAAAQQQAELIQKLALDNLMKQKRVTEKYLIDARFALARIYDHELGGAHQ